MFEKIVEIIKEQLGYDDVITMDTDLVKEIGIDSLDLVEIIMAIEDEYGIEIPDEDLEDALSTPTVAAIIDYLNARGVN